MNWSLAWVCIITAMCTTIIICACTWTKQEFFRWRDDGH